LQAPAALLNNAGCAQSELLDRVFDDVNQMI
jgi:hypothetical protein